MKKVIKLTESDLIKIVKKVIKEQKGDQLLTGFHTGAATGAAVGAGVMPFAPVIGGAVGGTVGGIIGVGLNIINGTGTSDQKVKQFCDTCKNSQAPITQLSNSRADTIRDAVQGAGTAETKIFNTFKSIRTPDEFCSLVKSYEQSYGVSLYDDLDDDIDQESEWVQIFRPIRDMFLRASQAQQQNAQKTPTTTPSTQPVARPTTQPQQKPVARPTRQY